MDDHGLAIPPAESGADGPDRRDPHTPLPLRADLLAAILRLDAPHGVLSVYAATDPADPDRARIEFKNACADLERAARDNGSGKEVHDALQTAHAGARAALHGGAAIAGFVPLGPSGADAIWVALPAAVPATVVRDAGPYALPLLSMIERFGESGVVTVARDRLALYDWANGSLEELERRSVDVDTGTWRVTQGPFNAASAGASGAISTVGSSDDYDHKLEDATVAELARVAAELIAAHGAQRRWERLMWFGDAAVVAAARASLRDDKLVHVVGDEAQMLGEAPAALLERVRRTSDERWRDDTLVRVRALAERRPADRVESLEETGTLAGDGRVGELYVTVTDDVVVDEHHRRVNALLADVVRHGGQVRGLRRAGEEDQAVVATLRW